MTYKRYSKKLRALWVQVNQLPYARSTGRKIRDFRPPRTSGLPYFNLWQGIYTAVAGIETEDGRKFGDLL